MGRYQSHDGGVGRWGQELTARVVASLVYHRATRRSLVSRCLLGDEARWALAEADRLGLGGVEDGGLIASVRGDLEVRYGPEEAEELLGEFLDSTRAPGGR